MFFEFFVTFFGGLSFEIEEELRKFFTNFLLKQGFLFDWVYLFHRFKFIWLGST